MKLQMRKMEVTDSASLEIRVTEMQVIENTSNVNKSKIVWYLHLAFSSLALSVSSIFVTCIVRHLQFHHLHFPLLTFSSLAFSSLANSSLALSITGNFLTCNVSTCNVITCIVLSLDLSSLAISSLANSSLALSKRPNFRFLNLRHTAIDPKLRRKYQNIEYENLPKSGSCRISLTFAFIFINLSLSSKYPAQSNEGLQRVVS